MSSDTTCTGEISMKPLRIGIVAGETSGDILGAGVIQALKQQGIQLEVKGIGGELMIAAGCYSFYPIERLSIMGLVEVVARLKELLSIRKQLRLYFLDNPPDVFIGIDSPDFTLKLETQLKQAGIPTVHYVSPSVWAWKPKRIFKIKKAADLVLALFPFEPAYYKKTKQRIEFVGHPLAKKIAMDKSLLQARNKFSLAAEAKVVAVLPGSRASEIKYLARPFLKTLCWLIKRKPELSFILPAANQECYDKLFNIIEQEFSELDIKLVLQQSREAMAASDAVLIASGTATLEAALLNKPMVVAYKAAPLTYAIYSRMLNSEFVSLPNILANRMLVPEILQQEVRPEVLGKSMLNALYNQEYRGMLNKYFSNFHQQLCQDSDQKAADAVIRLLQDKGVELCIQSS